MFDIGGWEFLVIVIVAVVVIGPKDLPAAIKAVAGWVAKARELAREFRSGLDELQREVELDKIQNEVRSSIGADEIEQTAHSIRNEIESAGREIEAGADPRQPEKDAWEEAYTYFKDEPDVAHGEVEAEARRRLAEAEAEEREAAAQAEPPAADGSKRAREETGPPPAAARGGAGA